MAKRGENIYKRKDGRWEARVIKGYDEHGRPTYSYFYGRTYKEAKEKTLMPLPYTKQESSPKIIGDVLRFEIVLDSWLGNSKVKLKESSYVKYFNLINNHIKPSLGKYPLTALTSTVLNDFTSEKLRTGKRDQSGGLSEKTVKDIISVIKSVLKFAKDESLMPETSINLILPREKKKDMRVLTKDEQATLERHLCSDLNESKLGILLCLYTGLRIGEICALKWIDISLEESILSVSRTMQRIQALDASSSSRTKVLETYPKSDCSMRTIPLPDFMTDMLRQFCPARKDAFFLTGESGRYIEPRTYQNHFKSYIEESGIKDANFHTTRHSFALRCIEVGFEIKSLSLILGHADVKVTLDRYVHPSLELKRSNMNKLTILH